MLAAAEAGADIIEVGVPWSDPSADGKAIQTAIHRALASGGGMTKSLALTRALRQAHPNLGIVLFGYANPIVVMGPRRSRPRRTRRAPTACCASTIRADEDAELTTALREASPGLRAAAGADVDAGAHRRRGEGRRAASSTTCR